jgi:hypothetical protein
VPADILQGRTISTKLISSHTLLRATLFSELHLSPSIHAFYVPRTSFDRHVQRGASLEPVHVSKSPKHVPYAQKIYLLTVFTHKSNAKENKGMGD